MSKYGSIVPEDIASNSFDFHGASIEIECDNIYPRYKPYMYFISRDGYNFPSSANTPPPSLCRNQIKQSTHNRSF